MEFKGLRGRVEIVKLLQASEKGRGGFGRILGKSQYAGTRVLTLNGGNYAGDSCLVRFDTESLKKGFPPAGRVITSKIPDGFNGLSLDYPFFIGLWQKDWNRSDSECPSLNEVRPYFEPGNVACATYIGEGGTFRIHYTGTNKMKGELYEIIRKSLETPWQNAKMLIAESEETLKEARRQIGSRRLTPIDMEPLRQKGRG